MTKIKQNIDNLIEKSNNIVITSHKNPDDDAIASILSVYFYIKKKFPLKNISMVISGIRLNQYLSLKYYSEINFVSEITNHIKEADLLIFTDCSEYKRFSDLPEVLQNSSPYKICIDHHPNTPDKFDVTLVDSEKTSATEIIYDLFFSTQKLDIDISEIILFGILGETNNFRYVAPSQSDVYLKVKKLIDISNIYLDDFLINYNCISIQVMQVLSHLMNNVKLHKIDNLPPFQTTYITPAFIIHKNIDKESISNACSIYTHNFLKLIDKHKWGFIAYPSSQPDLYSVSFRSIPSVINVGLIAKKMGIGGGHAGSAGAKVVAHSPNQTINIIIKWLETNTLQLS